MRVVIDLASVQDTARIMMAAADEYDLAAAALQRHDEMDGVTGRERYWLFSALDTAASRLRALANTHRQLAGDLTRRASVASSNRVSPVYAGLAVAAAPIVSDGGIRLDRDGDGTFDSVAYDRDGDGRYETFVTDRDLDGSFDTIFTTDARGELTAAAYDGDGDGFAEGFVGVTAHGVVRLHDADRDGYHEGVAWDRPSSYLAGSAVVSSATPGFRIGVDPDARASSLTLHYAPSTSPASGSRVGVDPNARSVTPLSVSSGGAGTPVNISAVPVPTGVQLNSTNFVQVVGAGQTATFFMTNTSGAQLLQTYSGMDPNTAGYGETGRILDAHLSSVGAGVDRGVLRLRDNKFLYEPNNPYDTYLGAQFDPTLDSDGDFWDNRSDSRPDDPYLR